VVIGGRFGGRVIEPVFGVEKCCISTSSGWRQMETHWFPRLPTSRAFASPQEFAFMIFDTRIRRFAGGRSDRRAEFGRVLADDGVHCGNEYQHRPGCPWL
jgi:hypothetical protein